MLYLLLNSAISGIVIAVASTLAKRYPGVGALVASLPLVSILERYRTELNHRHRPAGDRCAAGRF